MDEIMENTTDIVCIDCVEADFVTEGSISNEDLTQKIIPGFFLILIALRFSFVHLISQPLTTKSNQTKSSKTSARGRTGGFLRNLPWDGIIYLGASGTGILLTVLLAQSYEKTAVKDIYSVTFYLSFALYGTIDTVSYLKKGFVCEKLLKFLSLFIALVVDAVLYIENLQTGHVADVLQMATIITAALSTIGAFFNNSMALMVGITLTLHGTWMLHSASLDAVEGSWIGIYFCWHLIVISLAFFIIIIIKTKRSAPELKSTETDSKFSSLKSAISTPSTQLTDSEIEKGSNNLMDNSFLQKQMPVYNVSSEAPLAGLSVLPSGSSADSNANSTINKNVTSTSRDWAKPIHDKETVSSELRRTEIRTSFKPRHPVTVGLSPALSAAHQSATHSSQSQRSTGIQSRSTVVDSPAPSTTSTAFSLNPAQIEECAANMESRSYPNSRMDQDTDSENQDNVVYENTHLAPNIPHNIVNNCIYSAINKQQSQQEKSSNEPSKKSANENVKKSSKISNNNNEDYPVKIVESEPFDRISPIEEYNTLSRHVHSVRASIKLKESKFV